MDPNFVTRVFVIEDDQFFGKAVKFALEKDSNYEVTVYGSGQEFLDHLNDNPDIVIIDYNLPDISGLALLQKIRNYNKEICCIILSGQGTAEVVVEAYKNGAKDYIVKNPGAMDNLINAVKGMNSTVSLRKEVAELKTRIQNRDKYTEILGESKALLKVLRMIQKVETNNIMVLVTGESGTGKDLIGKAIHYNSARRREPYVPVNMAAIPNDLVESELFGHEKGAFTGAQGKRIGKFEEAHGGTIFLDEVGEMDLNLQSKMLRVLQDGTLSRVGSNKVIKLDVRVVAATNKNLGLMAKEGKFREDLFYRLQGFLIKLPPLRERGDDVIILAQHFLKMFCLNNRMTTKSFTKEVIERFQAYPWPGNVRELKSVVERAAILSDHEVISLDDIEFSALE
jgi:two-component system response regulator AtoC